MRAIVTIELPREYTEQDNLDKTVAAIHAHVAAFGLAHGFKSSVSLAGTLGEFGPDLQVTSEV